MPDSVKVLLSPFEMRVLAGIAHGRTNAAIAERYAGQAWRFELLGISAQSVGEVVGALKEKLRCQSNASLALHYLEHQLSDPQRARWRHANACYLRSMSCLDADQVKLLQMFISPEHRDKMNIELARELGVSPGTFSRRISQVCSQFDIVNEVGVDVRIKLVVLYALYQTAPA